MTDMDIRALKSRLRARQEQRILDRDADMAIRLVNRRRMPEQEPAPGHDIYIDSPCADIIDDMPDIADDWGIRIQRAVFGLLALMTASTALIIIDMLRRL